MLLWLMATGVVATSGSNIADATARNTIQDDAEEAARRLGFSHQQIEEVRPKGKSALGDAETAIDSSAPVVGAGGG